MKIHSKSLFSLMLLVVVICCTNLVLADGGTLTIANVADVVKLDPAYITDTPTEFVASMIYDNLVSYNLDGTIRPGLAASWEVSEDGLAWTFKLREDVQFHDGTPFNARAVKFNFDRIADPATASPGSEDISVVKSTEVVDEYTVRFNLENPCAAFLYKVLRQNEVLMLSPAAVEKWGEDVALHPVGTGPFVFKEWIPDTRVTLEKNPDYWDGAPILDKVIVRPIPDASTQRVELEAGTVDMIMKVDKHYLKSLQDNPAVTVYSVPDFNARYLFLNVLHPPLDNDKVRKAIAYSVNRQEIVQALLSGVAEELKGPLPETMWAAIDDLPEYEYNPAKGKELLAEAGWKDSDGDGFVDQNGEKLFMKIYSSDGRYLMDKEICGVLKNQLAKLGIDSEVKLFEWGAYLSAVDGGEHDICFLGWSQGNSEPGNFLNPQFLSHENGGWANDMFYHRDYIDELLLKGVQISDLEERKEIYAEFQKLVMADCPLVPLYSSYAIVAARDWVKGYQHNPSFYDFTTVYLKK